ncbi:lytic transglycosylase [Herbaspirillum rubrisubalbicans]|uniref:Lytic transglycosylase n=1 Tax=Herbaspirillum rubrisubalbicans TaxID=80842 RepID=A0ABX9BU40_9BURK|nr:lytic transglycosylase [Herbaspirillum rubrisubalbicans]RAM61221.1 hypothetical protein RB24_26250 [Herbaspirillum rubrisubalbicans]
MERKIYFCKSWFRAKKQPTELWTEDQARSAHQRKQPYTILVDSIERPFCFLEVSERAAGVGFLDAFLRESLTYSFQELEPGRFFLSVATYREFVGDTDRVASGTSYIFEQNGTVTIRKEIFFPEYTVQESVSKTDVAANSIAKPEFGVLGDLIRVER